MENEKTKPEAKVIGEDSNVFVTLAICIKALKRAGQRTEAAELTKKVMSSESYDDALNLMGEYCELV